MAIERLDRNEVFQFLRPDQMKKISEVAEEVSYAGGETIYEMGTRADYFYIVLEGQVSLRLPGYRGVSIQIDELTTGAIFGSCVCFQLANYSLNAQSTSDSRLLKISSTTLKEMMDQDLVLGYTIQTQISRIYFQRYIETMNKLQSIVMNLPLEPTRPEPERIPIGV
jgi:CRP-like cAMP-binding protein